MFDNSELCKNFQLKSKLVDSNHKGNNLSKMDSPTYKFFYINYTFHPTPMLKILLTLSLSTIFFITIYIANISTKQKKDFAISCTVIFIPVNPKNVAMRNNFNF
jgi:hypothetical protein